jgi:tetratricopeptide (TPR) repeat protein
MGAVRVRWASWGGGLALAVAALAAPASAQSGTDLRYPDFDRDQKAWNGKTVRMHARLLDHRFVVQTEHWDGEFFSNAGITDKNYRRFTVWFDGQEREGLFPVVSVRGGERLWAEVKEIPKESKVTLWGRIKRMGDGASIATGGAAVVPSIFHVTRIARGWVKDLPQYLEDLERPPLVEETVEMLAREGKAALGKLHAAAESKRLADRVRCAVLDAIGRIGDPGASGRLAEHLKTEIAPRVRTAVLVTLCKLDRATALAQLGRLLADPKSEEWAASTAVDLLAAEVAAQDELVAAFGAKWQPRVPALADAAVADAEAAMADGRPADAERRYTVALALVADRPATWLARGRVRQALAKVPGLDATPEGAERQRALRAGAQADFDRALDLGAEDADLMLARARALLDAGKPAEALPWLRKVLALRPEDAAVKQLIAASSDTHPWMVDARTSSMNGVTLRVPQAWKDAPEDCSTAQGRLLSVWGYAPKSTQKEPRSWVQIIVDVETSPGRRPDATGVPTLPDPAATAGNRRARDGHRILDTVSLPGTADERRGYAISEGRLEGAACRYLTGLVVTDQRVFEVWYRCTVEDWDAMLPIFKASFDSFRAAPDGK